MSLKEKRFRSRIEPEVQRGKDYANSDRHAYHHERKPQGILTRWPRHLIELTNDLSHEVERSP